MKLAVDQNHSSKCSGCPACSEAMATLLAASNTERADIVRSQICNDKTMKGNPMCKLDEIPAPKRLSEVILAEARNAKRLPSEETAAVIRSASENEHGVPDPPRIDWRNT